MTVSKLRAFALILSFNFGFGLFAQSSGNDGAIQFLSESEGEYIPEDNVVILRNKAQVIMEGMELYADLIRIDWDKNDSLHNWVEQLNFLI